MKRNILEKIIIILILSITIFNFCSVNFIFAANAMDGGYPGPSQPNDEEEEEQQSITNQMQSGSIDEMQAWMATFKGSYTQFYNDAFNKFELTIDSEIRAKAKEILQVEVVTNQDVQGIRDKYKSDAEKIKVIAHYKYGTQTGGTSLNPGGSSGYTFDYWSVQINLTKEETNEAIQIWKEKSEEDDKDSADAGGLLLGLLVPLVNFIADAIVASVGTIMNGHGLSFGMDILVPEAEKWQVPADVTEFTDVSTNSFVVGGMQYPNITYTPEEIFAGKIDLLSIDFISGKNFQGMQNTNSDWNGIRATISQWYQVLRLIAIIGLLSVLIYTGIKIILSATAKDRAKYKEWIMNWFMAVAILFSMHFIMAFIIAVTGEISQLITEVSQNIYVRTSGGETFATNLMGLVRFMVQSDNFYMKVGYEVMYIALIVYTIKFTFVYLKRVLNMAFLTLIAPIVALTYPIDKVNDGKAQGFDMWLKEYTFNALLQPMHCIVYYVLVGSAVGIAASNPIYGIVVLAFMTEAEKLLKSIFGFSKAGAGTVGGVGSAFAAGAIASNIAKMAKFPKGNAGKGGSGSSGGDDNALDAPKPTNRPGMDVFDNEPQGSSEEGSTEARMQEADDERFGTDEYDSAEREANIRNSTEPTPGSMYEGMSEEEQIEQMRNSGMDDETIAQAMAQRNGEQSGSGNSQPDGEAEQTGQPNGDSGEPVREMATAREEQRQQREAERQQNKEKGKFAKGIGNVVKTIAKPVWDSDKSASYNLKRLGKGALKGTAKAVGGFALGATAAAVQAGISITDGKYNPMEGIAAVTAGFAGAGGIVDRVGSGIGSVIDTYREGADAGDTTAQMERAQKRFADRDDVIAFNKKNYPGKEKEAMERQRNNYLTAGVTDLKEMKYGMKYADSLVGKTDGLSAEQIKARRDNADRQAAATINFEKALRDQGQFEAIRNKQKQQSYIDTMVSQAADADKARVRRQYENAFKSVAAYHNTKA